MAIPVTRRLFRTCLFLALAALVAGCAGAPPTPEPPAEADRTLYSFYPLPPAPPRVQYLTRFSLIEDVTGSNPKRDPFWKRWIMGRPEQSEDPNPIPQKPFGIAAVKDRIYVSDTKEARVVVYDLAGRRQYVLPTRGLGKLGKPTDLYAEPGGYLFVADIGRHTILVYDQNGNYVTTYGKPDQFKPASVWVHGDEVFVADMRDNEVEVLDRRTGAPKRKFGGTGREAGQFNAPTSLAVSREDKIYVTDTFNFRVQQFDLDGNPLSSIGQPGDVLGTFSRPRGLTITPDGVLCVLDAAFEAAQMFDETGRILMSFGNPDEIELPARITWDAENIAYFQKYVHPAFEVEQLLYVTNNFGPDAISVYGFGHLRDPSKPIGVEELKPVPDYESEAPAIAPLSPGAEEPVEEVE